MTSASILVRFRCSIQASILVLVLALIATSCGGGGGGGATLRYQTDWTNRGRAVTGLSQRVQVFDSLNRLKKSVIVNQDANGIMVVSLGLGGSGEYHLFVELFSGRDLGGVLTGVLDSWVSVGKSTTFTTAVGLDPTSIKVTPQSATILVQHSKQFYATGTNGLDAVFVAPNSFNWETLGGTASVNGSGLVLGGSQGPGTVRATHLGTGFQGSAIFDVQPFNTTTSKWTVIVFLNAANDLFPFSDLNVNQMEEVAQNPEVRFVIQWKQSQAVFPGSSFDGTRRYLARPDGSVNIASELVQDMGDGVDMGRPQTMLDFINWAKTFYPAQRYVLVVWNHGNGWRRRPEGQEAIRAVSYDDETGNAIQIWQLSQGIGSNVIDILAWDASLMQMLEVAYEIQDRCRYIAGSEESPPGEGYPYDSIFRVFRDNPDSSTVTLSKAFVDGMVNHPPYFNRKITQSVIDPTQLPALATAVDALSDELIANVGSLGTVIPAIRNAAQSYSDSGSRRYRDLYHLCQLMESQISIPAIQAAAANVRAAITAAMVWEGHNSNSPNSHGASIDFSSSTQFAGAAADYAQMRFAADTSWNEWLAIAP